MSSQLRLRRGVASRTAPKSCEFQRESSERRAANQKHSETSHASRDAVQILLRMHRTLKEAVVLEGMKSD